MHKALLGLTMCCGVATAAAPGYLAVVDSTALAQIDTAALGIDLAALGYSAAGAVPGVRIDLNADGTAELLLRGGPTFCGTGGCSYFLFDGRDGRPLGSVFGSTVIVQAMNIGGWVVLCTFARGGASAGTFATFVVDGAQYVRVSAVELRTESVTDLFNSLRAVTPAMPAR